ncbi:MAG: hypothetical protein AB8G05_20280 [Oligoflexales bacterium]
MDPYLKAFGQVGASVVHGLTCLLGSYALGEWLEQNYSSEIPWMEISVFSGVFLSLHGFVWMAIKLQNDDKD